MTQKLPKILHTSVVASTTRVKIERVHLRFSNQEERFYERSKSALNQNESVMVVPLLNDDTLLLVREYAVGFEKYCLGFPKGGVDSGESVEQAAQREIREEIGYGAKSLSLLCQFAASPSYSSHLITVFLARGLHSDSLVGDEPEALEIVPWALSEADALLSHPDFIESRSVAALLLFLRKHHAS